MELWKSSKKLVLLYELFYKEKADFGREDVQRKAMAMVYLLWEYSVFLPTPTSFKLSLENTRKVWSKDVQNLFSNCIALSQDDFKKGKEDDSWSISFAELIGRIVSIYLPIDEVQWMENTALISFLRNHAMVFPTMDTIASSKYVTCSYEEVQIIADLLLYLDNLRDYICGIGCTSDGVVKDIDLQADIIVGHALKKNKNKN